MPTLAQLGVEFTADLRGLLNGFNAAGEAMNRFTQSVQRSSEFLRSTGLAITTVGAGLSAFVGITITEAAKAAQAQQELAAAIKASQEAIDPGPLLKQASALQALTRFSDEAIIGVQRTLVQFGATQAQVERLTPLVLDLGQALGRDIGTTAEAIGRGLSGAGSALSRFVGQLPGGITLSENFDAAVDALDQRFGGFAETAGRTLPGALAQLRNAISDLLETLGAPLVAPVVEIVQTFAQFARQIQTTIAAVPGLTTVIAAVTVILAGLLAAIGGIILTLGTLGVSIAGIIAGAAALGVALTPVGAIILVVAAAVGTLIVALAAFLGIRAFTAQFDDLSRAIQTLGVFISATAREIGGALSDLVQAARDFNLDGIIAAIRRLHGSFQVGAQEARKFAAEQAKVAEESKKAAAGVDAVRKSVEQIKQEYEQASKQAELFALQARAAALEAARRRLQQPGLSEAELKDTQERLAQNERAIEEASLRERIRREEQTIGAIKRARDGSGKELLAAERRLAEARTELEKLVGEETADALQKRFDAAKDTAARIFEAEKEAATQRIALEKQARDAIIETFKATADAQRATMQARAELDREAAQRQIDAFRLVEQIRLGLLQRTIALERTIGDAILRVRESLSRAQNAQDERLLKEGEEARTKAVREGFLTADEARVQAAEQRLQIATQQAARELALEEERQAQITRRAEFERTVLQAQAQSRIAILALETQERVRQVDVNTRLRLTELETTKRISALETQARIAEFQAQTQAHAAELKQRLALDRAAGRVTPAEETRRRRAIGDVERQAEIAALGFRQAQVERERGITQQQEIITQNSEEAKNAIRQEGALKTKDIAANLAVELAEIDARLVESRAASVERLTRLEITLADVRRDAKKVLDEVLTFEAFVQPRLQAADTVANRIKDAQRAATQATQADLTVLQGAYSALVSNLQTLLPGAIKTLTDFQEPIKFLLGGAQSFQTLLGGLQGKVDFIAAAYTGMAGAIQRAIGPALDMIRELIRLQGQVTIPAPPVTPPGPPRPRSDQPAVPGAVAARTQVTVPVVLNGQVIGEQVLDFVEGRLVSWLQATPTA